MLVSEVQLMMIRPDLFDCECHVRTGNAALTIDTTQELVETTGILVQVSNTLVEVMKNAGKKQGNGEDEDATQMREK